MGLDTGLIASGLSSGAGLTTGWDRLFGRPAVSPASKAADPLSAAAARVAASTRVVVATPIEVKGTSTPTMVPIAPSTDRKIASAVGVVWGSEKFAASVPSWPKTSASMLSRIACTNAPYVMIDLEVALSKTYVDLGIYINHVPNGIPGQVSPPWYIAAWYLSLEQNLDRFVASKRETLHASSIAGGG